MEQEKDSPVTGEGMKLFLEYVLLVCITVGLIWYFCYRDHNPVKKYSREHRVTCKSRSPSLYDDKCSGGDVVNGNINELLCDYQYECSDGHIITWRF